MCQLKFSILTLNSQHYGSHSQLQLCQSINSFPQLNLAYGEIALAFALCICICAFHTYQIWYDHIVH